MRAASTPPVRRRFLHFTGTPLYLRRATCDTQTPLVFTDEVSQLNLRVVQGKSKTVVPVTHTDNPLALNESLCEEEDIPIVLGRGTLSEPSARRSATRLADERGWHKKPRCWFLLHDIVDCGLQHRVRGLSCLSNLPCVEENGAQTAQRQRDAINAIPHLQLTSGYHRVFGMLINAELLDVPTEWLQPSQWPLCLFAEVDGKVSFSVAAGHILQHRHSADLETGFVSPRYARALGLQHSVAPKPVLGGHGSVSLLCSSELPRDDAELFEFACRYRAQNISGPAYFGPVQAALARASWDSRQLRNPLTEFWVEKTSKEAELPVWNRARWALNSTTPIVIGGKFFWNVRSVEKENNLL